MSRTQSDAGQEPECATENSGTRYVTGRRYDLLVPKFIEGMAQIMHVGAEKYGECNWQRGLPGHKNGITHAYGHINDYQQGKPNDYGPLGLHLCQAAVNVMFEFHFWDQKTEEEKRVIQARLEHEKAKIDAALLKNKRR